MVRARAPVHSCSKQLLGGVAGKQAGGLKGGTALKLLHVIPDLVS